MLLSANVISRLGRYNDVVLAVIVAAIVGMMIIPIPEALLDVLITTNIAMALVILLVAIYSKEALEFSVFPSLLLVATLFRLGLNISATRLILLEGHAGRVIEAFGQFVVGGNYVVGVVVFLILVVIQFVVITNGASRVAEVAARFTLDAMPGKQMAIDADLNAGLITENEARRRRKAIQQEADFYGAMDGASKFVKGDAIAGIIIIIVNILGGIIIGVVQRGIPLLDALSTYTLLTVGDGLVSQIPAILISTASGIIITRSSSENNLGADVSHQLVANPRALAIVAGLLVALALVPGLPKPPLFALAGLLGGVAYLVYRRPAPDVPLEEVSRAAEPSGDPQDVAKLLAIDPIEIEIGYGLIPLADAEQGGSLLSRITLVRRQLALDLGIVIPTIRIRDNLQLDPNAYVIKLRGIEVASGEIRANRYLAMNPGIATEEIPGMPTTEPTFGLPALWISAEDRERAEMLGYTVVDPASVLTTHLTEVLKANAATLIGRQEVQALVDGVKSTHPALVSELIPELVTLGDIQKVLQNLLRERVSVRDLVIILETIADNARVTRDPDTLAEQVRQALSRSIVARYQGPDGRLHALTLSPTLQQSLAGALEVTDRGVYLNLDPGRSHRILQQIAREMEKMAAQGHQPILLVPARLRLPIRRLVERSLSSLVVLSYSEVPPQVEVVTSGLVSSPDEA